MAPPRSKPTLFSSGSDRWLVLAGAGLLVLGLVLRLLTDIGRSTAQGDTTTPTADTAVAQMPAPLGTTAETLAATPAPSMPDTSPSAPGLTATPVSQPKMKRPQPSTLATDGWGVQLGAFSQRSNAERLQSQVQHLGYATSVGASGKLTRVRVGGLSDRGAAQQAADSIARTLGTRGLVVGPGH